VIIQVSHQGYLNWRKMVAAELRRKRAKRPGQEWWRKWRSVALPEGVFVGPATSGEGSYAVVDIDAMEAK